MPIAAPSAGSVRAMPRDGVAGGARLVRRGAASRRRSRAPSRRVAGDVDGDAGERERRRRSRSRARSRPCARGSSRRAAASRQRPPEERHGDRERERARSRPARSAPCRAPTTGASACSSARRRAARPAAAPRRAAPRPAAAPREWASGSQLCTGAQPILRGEAGEQQQIGDERRLRPRAVTARERAARRARRARRRGMPACEDDDPEQRDAEAERGEDQVLPAGLERARLAAEADEQRRGGGRRLDQQPGGAEVPGERHREQDRPEREEGDEVAASRARGRPSELRPRVAR